METGVNALTGITDTTPTSAAPKRARPSGAEDSLSGISAIVVASRVAPRGGASLTPTLIDSVNESGTPWVWALPSRIASLWATTLKRREGIESISGLVDATPCVLELRSTGVSLRPTTTLNCIEYGVSGANLQREILALHAAGSAGARHW